MESATLPPDHGGRRAGRASRRRRAREPGGIRRARPIPPPAGFARPRPRLDRSSRRPGQFSGHRGARLPQQRRGGTAAAARPRRPPPLRGQQDAPSRRRGGWQGGDGRALPLRQPVRRRRGRDRLPLLHQRGREHHRERDGLAAGRQRGRGRAALRHHLRALPRARAPGGGRTEDHPVAGRHRDGRRLRRADRRPDAAAQRGVGVEPQRLPLRPARSWPTSPTRTGPTSTPTPSRRGATSRPTSARRRSTSPAAMGTSGCTRTSAAHPSTCAASTWTG